MKHKFGIAIAVVLFFTSTLSALGTAQKVTRILAMKRFQVEISLGTGLERVSGLPERGRGVDALMRQYADAASTALTEEGQIRENFLRLPLRVAAVYRLNPEWSVKGGLGFSTGSLTSRKEFVLDVYEVREKHDITIQDRLTLFSPFVELEKRFGRFSAYAGLGIQWGQLRHLFDSTYSEIGYDQELHEEIQASGVGPMVYLGGAYRYPLGENMQVMARLEVRFSRISGWSGDRVTREEDSLGNQQNTSADGDLVKYETDPYGSGWISSWGMGPVSEDSGVYRSVSPLSSDFSGIRFTLGICF